MITIHVTQNTMHELTSYDTDQIILPFNSYWVRKFDTAKNGKLQEVRIATLGRGHVSSINAMVEISRMGYRYLVKIKLIER